MKTSLQTRKKTFRTSAAKTADSKPTDGQVAIQIESLRRRSTIATASCERRGVRLRGRAKRGAREHRACQHLPNSGVPRSFRKNLEQPIRKETQQTFATSPILPERNTSKRQQEKSTRKIVSTTKPPNTLVSGKCTEVERMEIIIPTQITQCGETLTTFLSQLAQNVDGKATNTELPTSQVQPEEESRSSGFGGERML